MNRLEIAKDAYKQIVEAILDLQNKLGITCDLPNYIELDGEIFFRDELKDFCIKRDETGKLRIVENALD